MCIRDRYMGTYTGNSKDDSALLDIKIDLGNGVEEHITMREGDTEEDIARAFCLKHSMSVQQRTLLVVQIKKAMKEQVQSQDYSDYLESNIYDKSISENVDAEMQGSVVGSIPVMSARVHKFKNSGKAERKEFGNAGDRDKAGKKRVASKENVNCTNKKSGACKESGKRFHEYVRASKEKEAKVKEQLEKNWEAQHPFKPSINKK
eukprot:TRINITY_DN13361_c0_g1_i10.p3 TRINITY_DN13361_c0_g1~~TRINITY_DN13361_c0_g1_i10.p3  ORF type:complete len:205 (-),score=83.75 TRINITY_DN13361_c0_g1_i10:895-1509(-)